MKQRLRQVFYGGEPELSSHLRSGGVARSCAFTVSRGDLHALPPTPRGDSQSLRNGLLQGRIHPAEQPLLRRPLCSFFQCVRLIHAKIITETSSLSFLTGTSGDTIFTPKKVATLVRNSSAVCAYRHNCRSVLPHSKLTLVGTLCSSAVPTANLPGGT